MNRTLFLLPLAAALPLLAPSSRAADRDSNPPPAPQREFRGVWVATVDNIDWPSKPGLPVEQQQKELLAILDRAVQLRLNAVVFQVRPSTDSFYASKLEPWSEFLTGKMGQAPQPFYDPLQFAVDEAHKRGLELHAWFNPYRARHPAGKSELSPNHLSRTKPELVKQYGKFMWMDPGEKGTQDHSLAVMLDVIRRYDIDGVHIDDYFYPYKEKDASGSIIPFPDEPSWQKYVRAGGKLGRDDWRRQNVDQFIQRLYREIKKEKRWVKFGISPFGIWRPGYPAQIQGFDQYSELYADARKWLLEGWVDYFTPQLYWPIDRRAQSYPVLLKWWSEQNPKGRHLWPGNYTGRVGDGTGNQWPAREVLDQIRVTRQQSGATGNIHFSMKVFMQNRGGLNDQLAATAYAEPALVPASPWLDQEAPPKPEARLEKDNAAWKLTWEPAGKEKVWEWVLQTRTNGRWLTQILPGQQTSWTLLTTGAPLERVALSAVDRNGNQSPPAELTPQE